MSEHPQPPRQTPRDYDGPKAFRDHPGVATKERSERSEVITPIESGFDDSPILTMTEYLRYCEQQFAQPVAAVSSSGAEITA